MSSLFECMHACGRAGGRAGGRACGRAHGRGGGWVSTTSCLKPILSVVASVNSSIVSCVLSLVSSVHLVCGLIRPSRVWSHPSISCVVFLSSASSPISVTIGFFQPVVTYTHDVAKVQHDACSVITVSSTPCIVIT